MLKKVPDDRLELGLINLISLILVRLFMFYSRCHLCTFCGAAESRKRALACCFRARLDACTGILTAQC